MSKGKSRALKTITSFFEMLAAFRECTGSILHNHFREIFRKKSSKILILQMSRLPDADLLRTLSFVYNLRYLKITGMLREC